MYLVQGRQLGPDDTDFGAAVADAYAARQRPRCLCRPGGIEMYIARLGFDHLVKRMPYSGNLHAPECPSYEPPAELSGLGQVLRTAVLENPATGITSLRLGFSMSKGASRTITAATSEPGDSVAGDGTHLSLPGLLHYLWDQAELTRWHPGFAGKRSWAVVRKHLLAAAQSKVACGMALSERLYVPETFSVEHREEINTRRVAQLNQATATSAGALPLLLLIGELKEIVPARYGFKAVIKHMPDQPFAVDEALYRRIGRRFGRELSLWGTSDAVHMLVIATFGLNRVGVPTIEVLSLMPVNGQWLPVENGFDKHLLDHLVQEGRSFLKLLSYNLPSRQLLASAVLIDAGEAPVSLRIQSSDAAHLEGVGTGSDSGRASAASAWVWRTDQGPMPGLPPKCRNSEAYSPVA